LTKHHAQDRQAQPNTGDPARLPGINQQGESEGLMAWTETCKIDANKQVQHLKKKGMSVRQAIKKLSDESGIPENTINNWIYQRVGKKRVDAFHHFFETIHMEMVKDGGATQEQVDKTAKNERYVALWCILWLNLKEENILNWYKGAFQEHGGNIKLTDMFRTGHIRCECPNCDGKVHNLEKPLLEGALTQKIKEVLSPKGYVNFNVM